MLQTYTLSSAGITLNTNDSVPFNTNSLNTLCKVVHTAGSPSIEINRPGYYQVTVNSFGYNTGEVVEGTPYSGTYTLQLFNKGVAVENAIASASSTSSTAVENIEFSVIIKVNPSCCMVDNNAVLTLNYLGQEGTLSFVNLTIERLD